MILKKTFSLLCAIACCLLVSSCTEYDPEITIPDNTVENNIQKFGEAEATMEDSTVFENDLNTVISPVHLVKTGNDTFRVETVLPPTRGILVVLLEIVYRLNPGDPHFLEDQVLVTIPKWGTGSQGLGVKNFAGTLADVRIRPMSDLRTIEFPA